MPTIIIHSKVSLIKQEQARYVFSYTITIENQSERDVQLLTRYWHIEDSNNKVQQVQGDGVIGKTPHIKVGESFTYTSGAVIETPFATMHGHFGMRDDQGKLFDVEVPMFLLADKNKLH